MNIILLVVLFCTFDLSVQKVCKRKLENKPIVTSKPLFGGLLQGSQSGGQGSQSNAGSNPSLDAKWNDFKVSES
jgi:hypothetical protein